MNILAEYPELLYGSMTILGFYAHNFFLTMKLKIKGSDVDNLREYIVQRPDKFKYTITTIIVCYLGLLATNQEHPLYYFLAGFAPDYVIDWIGTTTIARKRKENTLPK